jgi:hypothetical protein
MSARQRHKPGQRRGQFADPVAAEDQACLRQVQPSLAAFARAGYRRWGRGFVCLRAEALNAAALGTVALHADYLGEQSNAAQGDAWASRGVVGLVQAYDPQQEALVAVDHHDGLRIYRVALLSAST